MPLAILLIGAVLILVAVRNTHGELGQLLSEDLFPAASGSSGAGSSVGFFLWLGAIALIGALGFVPALKTPSRLLLAIVLLGLAVKNTGAFANLAAAVKTPPTAEPAQPDPATKLPPAIPVQLSGAGGGAGSGIAGAASSAASKAATSALGGLFGL
jgi:hypothetical protein